MALSPTVAQSEVLGFRTLTWEFRCCSVTKLCPTLCGLWEKIIQPIRSDHISRSVVSDSLRPHESQLELNLYRWTELEWWRRDHVNHGCLGCKWWNDIQTGASEKGDALVHSWKPRGSIVLGIAGSLVVSGPLQVWFHLLHFPLFYFLAKPHAGS